LKTLFKKAVSAQDAEVTKSVEAQFDKAAQKGIIHPNKAARKKSRMAKAAVRATAAAASAPAAKTTGKKKAAK
jgi:ribosomal protein S20